MKNIFYLLLCLPFGINAQNLSDYTQPFFTKKEKASFLETFSKDAGRKIEMDTALCHQIDEHIEHNLEVKNITPAKLQHDIALELSMSDYLVKSLCYLAELYNKDDVWFLAFKTLIKAEKIAKAFELNQELIQIHFVWGKIHIERRDFSKAQEHFNKLEVLMIDSPDAIKEKFIIEIAELYQDNDKFSNSIQYYFKLLNLSEISTLHKFATNYRIGNYFLKTNVVDKAIYYLTKSLEFSPKRNVDRAYALVGLSNAYLANKELDKALNNIQEAVSIAEKQGLGLNKWIQNELAVILEKKGDKEGALSIFKELLVFAEKEKDHNGIATYNNNIGWIYMKQRKFDQALIHLNNALVINDSEKAGNKLITLDNLGHLFFLKKDYPKAISFYKQQEKYMDILNPQKMSYQEEKQAYLEVRTTLNSSFAKIYLAKGQIEEVFYYAEANKANLLNENMIARNQRKAIQTPDYLIKRKKIEKDIELIQAQKRNEQINIALDQQFFELQTLDKNAFKENKSIIPAPTIRTKRLEEIQSVLAPDELLLEYSFDNKAHGGEVLLFYVTEEFSGAIQLDSFKVIEQEVQKYRQYIAQNKTRNDKLAYVRFLKSCSNLYNLLIQPLEEKGVLGNKKLIIIPDQILHLVPFETFIVDGNWRNAQKEALHFLIQDNPIVYYPSATTLHFIRKNKSNKKSNFTKDVLAIGEPIFNETKSNSTVSKEKQLDTLNRIILGRNYNFKNLPYTGLEVSAIGDIYTNSTILNRAKASEQDLKKRNQIEDLSNYRYIHFSTHGIINETYPELSCLVLSKDNADLEDGLLHTYEIADLNLQTELVVLSACDTGLGRLVDGEGVVGFVQALLDADTPSLVLSLWSVADKSTATLFTNFYQILKNNKGLEKQAALRDAQLVMIAKGGEWANPYYWGAFVFVGEGE